MAVRMIHPQHGRAVAVGIEVAQNLANGWEIEVLKTKVPIVEVFAETPVEIEVEERTEVQPVIEAPPPVPTPKKRGRKPKGK